MTTTTEQDNAVICKNCNSPLGNHIIPKNNCPQGFDYYHAGRFFEPQDTPPKAEILTDILDRMIRTTDEISKKIEEINAML